MPSPKVKEIRFSDHFNLAKGQAELDFVDVPINGDARLFVDPYAFTLENDPWFTGCNNLLIDFFSLVVDSIRSGNIFLAERLLSNLHEPQETHLGFSKIGSSGRGIGRSQAMELLDTLRASQAVQTGQLNDLSDCELLIPGISADKISDITINIIRGQLIDYTEAQCSLHNIPTSNVPGGVFWDDQRRNWVNRYANLPLYKGGRIILIPKASVRFRPDITASEFYDRFVLQFLEAEHLRANDSLVQTLKNGKRVVLKKDLKKKHPLTKELLFEMTQKYPELLRAYKSQVKERSAPLRDSELELVHQEFREIDYQEMANELDAIPAGAHDASTFHNFIFGALQAIFYPGLRYPKKEEEIHEGRKRIDITFNNGDRTGFFSDLGPRYHVLCPFVIFECKNYSTDPVNPELDQMTGRFGERRGNFGIIVCRQIQDRALILRRCKDVMLDGRGWILAFDDTDVKQLLAFRAEGKIKEIDRFMHEKMRELIM